MKSSFKEFLAKIDFEDPSQYDFDSDKNIDENIKETLKNINKSSWCWTLFSCEGHLCQNEAKTLPYFVFVVKRKYTNFLLGFIFETLNPKIEEKTQFPLINSKDVIVSWGFTDDKYAIVNAHWSSDFLSEPAHSKLLKDFYNMSFKILEAKL
jgi:hypothetical protein